MALLKEEFNRLNDLFIQQLKDIYDAEQRLIDALPKMEQAASTASLKQAFRMHEQQTEQHARRLEQIFGKLGCPVERETCDGMKGIIAEGQDMIKARGDDKTRDAALIAAAQRTEHYEIASYGTLRTFAQQLGYNDVAQTLQQTLNEEGETDKKLTQIAESSVNVQAAP